MLLSRFVKIQLTLFAALSVIGLVVMATVYLRLPALAGLGTMTVAVDLPATGGLYRFGNVTYRGVRIGEVTSVQLTDDGVRAVLALDTDRPIPADLEAQVRSVSAVGEQYVDLRPRTGGPPYLTDGAVIPRRDTTVPQPVGPMLDSLSGLVGTIPADRLHGLLDELFQGLHGATYDLDSLLTSAERISGELTAVAPRTRTLIEEARPLLDGQAASADAIALWTRSLSGVTAQVVANDPQLRHLLTAGPGFAGEVRGLLEAVRPTLPVLLANLTSVGQLGVTYHAGLEQLLVLLPPAVSMIQAVQPNRNASGLGLGDFRISGVSDPPACTVGFLPPSEWRSPEETTTIDTPEDLYCKLPQDSDIAVRGVRNIPCAEDPARRAPTAELCRSPEGFVPLAPDQPLLGPYPRDPNLEGQGIPPDSRYGTAPAAHTGTASPGIGFAHYDPATGNYLGPDGKLYQQTDLAAPAGPGRAWTDLLTH